MTYSRAHPSQRYIDLLDLYKQGHTEGLQESGAVIAAEKTFTGKSLPPHARTIKSLIDKFQVTSVLDYGAGKAKYYNEKIFPAADGQQVDLRTYWGVDRIHLYDPGYAPLATLPDAKLDMVISTDVMEHIPEEDLDWVIDEMLSFANKVLYACIATYPAVKTFPNGENVHVTLHDAHWWVRKFNERRDAIGPDAPHYFLVIFNTPDGKKPIAVPSF